MGSVLLCFCQILNGFLLIDNGLPLRAKPNRAPIFLYRQLFLLVSDLLLILRFKAEVSFPLLASGKLLNLVGLRLRKSFGCLTGILHRLFLFNQIPQRLRRLTRNAA